MRHKKTAVWLSPSLKELNDGVMLYETPPLLLMGQSIVEIDLEPLRKEFDELKRTIKRLHEQSDRGFVEPTPFRCEAVNEILGSRCVRRGGHALKHAFPNLVMKKSSPCFWEALQDSSSTLNVDELGDKESFEFVDQEG